MANVRSNRIAFHLKTEANGPMPVALQLVNWPTSALEINNRPESTEGV